MDLQKIIIVLEKSECVGFILPSSPSLDVLVSAETLMQQCAKTNKAVGLLFPRDQANINDTSFFPMLSNTKPLPKEFIISLNTSADPVSQLRYEKHDSLVDIIISPKTHTFGQHLVSFRDGIAQCDLIVILGAVDSSTFPLDVQELIQRVQTIRLAMETTGPDQSNNDASSIAEKVYRLVKEVSDDLLVGEHATRILAGILQETDYLRRAQANTLRIVAELLERGAHAERAKAHAHSAVPLELTQLFCRATVRSKTNGAEGVFWSFLTAEDFEKTSRGSEDIDPVLDRLEKEFPKARIRALVWQEPREKNVRIALSGEPQLLDAIRGRVAAEFRSPHLHLTEPFLTFQEAEANFMSLLKEVL